MRIYDMEKLSTRAVVGQAIGYLGARAVTGLSITSAFRPLASAVSFAAYRVCNSIMKNFCDSIGLERTHISTIVSVTVSLVAGAAVFVATSALSFDNLVAINLIILAIFAATKLV